MMSGMITDSEIRLTITHLDYKTMKTIFVLLGLALATMNVYSILNAAYWVMFIAFVAIGLKLAHDLDKADD